MNYYRNTVIAKAKEWLGKNEADGSHKSIIDIYNTISPLPRGYKMGYNVAWCCTFVSAVFHTLGYDAIFPLECGCGEAVAGAQKMGIWVENDAYVPAIGDAILYDWQDSGVGDNTGWPDHIGLVEKVEGTTMTIIEGNYSNSVKRRVLEVNAKSIRGYITPKYTAASEPAIAETIPTADAMKQIWDFLMSKIGNAFGVAGIMGNLYAESAYRSNNLENKYEKSLGMTDEQYTAAVDNGTYTNFVNDHAGYGLVQWTYWTRKRDLLAYAQKKGTSISDLTMQLEFLMVELADFKLLDSAKNAKSVKEMSDLILTKFEMPADMSDAVKEKRASYGQTAYNKFVTVTEPAKEETKATETSSVKEVRATDSPVSKLASLSGAYKVTTALYCRNGAGVGKKILVVMPKDTKVRNYGYYTDVAGTKWLYVQFTMNNIKYTGFASSKYLKKC